MLENGIFDKKLETKIQGELENSAIRKHIIH